jgi:hypothetical protein
MNVPIVVGTVVVAIAFVCDARREDKAVPLGLLGGLPATAAVGAVTWGLSIGSSHRLELRSHSADVHR